MTNVQRAFVLLPVVGVGVTCAMNARVVPHWVDDEIGDCVEGGGGEGERERGTGEGREGGRKGDH